MGVIAVLLSVADAAMYLNISQRTLHRMFASGEIPKTKVGRLTRVRRSDLDDYIRRNTQGNGGVA
jgi:excisionase family DNA binding protein